MWKTVALTPILARHPISRHPSAPPAEVKSEQVSGSRSIPSNRGRSLQAIPAKKWWMAISFALWTTTWKNYWATTSKNHQMDRNWIKSIKIQKKGLVDRRRFDRSHLGNAHDTNKRVFLWFEWRFGPRPYFPNYKFYIHNKKNNAKEQTDCGGKQQTNLTTNNRKASSSSLFESTICLPLSVDLLIVIGWPWFGMRGKNTRRCSAAMRWLGKLLP